MKFVRIDFAAVPLANVEVAVGVDRHVMTVLEHGLVLKEDGELTVLVAGFASSRVGDDTVGFVEDGNETALLPHTEVVGFCAETHT